MPVNDPNRVYDGFTNLLGGINAGVQPHLVREDQAADSVNITYRGGYATTRPPWSKKNLTFAEDQDKATFYTGNPQGLGVYTVGQKTYLIASIDGQPFAIDVQNDFTTYNVNPEEDAVKNNPKLLPKAYMCQADTYFVIQDGQSPAIILNGLSSSRAKTTGEDQQVPTGTSMAYGLGRLWVANGNQFVAGDILGGPTSVIDFTENTYLAENGTFKLPSNMGNINGMAFIPLQDTATGQGQLLVGADFGVASVQAQLPRTAWQSTQIQQVALLGIGWASNDANVLLNGDIVFRSYDGVRTYRMARAEQGINGQKPQSMEVNPYVSTDTQRLLKYASGVYFDNRVLITTAPTWRGTYCTWSGLLSMDSYPVGSLFSQSPPVWEGVWTGVEIVQIVAGIFGKEERCFALVRKINDDGDDYNEIWELKKEGYYDEADGVQTRIQSKLWTRSFEHGSSFEQKKLLSGDLFIANIAGEVDWSIKYRPDEYPCFFEWDSGNICFDVENCAASTCNSELQKSVGYSDRIRLPNPDQLQHTPCVSNGEPATKGFEFQLLLEWTGYMSIRQYRNVANKFDQETTGGSNCA